MKSLNYKKYNMTVWNEIAPRYQKRWIGVKTGPFQSGDVLVDMMNFSANDRVLDVACGTGAITARVVRRVKKGMVVGGDTSITALRLAKRKIPSAHFINMDAENFRFSESFDVVTCQFGLFFFPDAQKALKNMKRCLRRGGRLGVTVHGEKYGSPFFSSIMKEITRFIPDYIINGSPDLARFGTKKALGEEIRQAGFERIRVRDVVYQYSPGTFNDYWKNYTKYVAKPLRQKISDLSRDEKIELRNSVKKNTKRFTNKTGKIIFPWQVLIASAQK